MSVKSAIADYETILLGTRKEFSTNNIGQNANRKTAVAVFKYAIEEILHWTPSETRDFLTWDLVQKLHLERMAKALDPPEFIDLKEAPFYISYLVYPETKNFSDKAMVLYIYHERIDTDPNGKTKISKYPKGFFGINDGERNLCYCMQNAVSERLPTMTTQGLYRYFADEANGYRFLRESKLEKPAKMLYSCPIDLLHAALPANEKSDLYYTLERFKYEYNKSVDREHYRNQAKSEREKKNKRGSDSAKGTKTKQEKKREDNDRRNRDQIK